MVAHTSAQKDSAEVIPKNQIDIFYHTDHFFDNSETYWLKFNPSTFGISYTRKLKGKHNVTTSISAYSAHYYRYYQNNNIQKTFGTIEGRSYFKLTFGYVYNLLKLKFFEIDLIGLYNYRVGDEIMYIYRPYSWEERSYTMRLSDSGFSIGSRLGFDIKNFIISLEALYTSYLIRPDKVEFYYGTKRSTQNTATFKFGLGYRF